MKFVPTAVILFSALTAPFFSFASDFRLRAVAVDSIGQAEAYVTWSVHTVDSLNSLVAGALTGEDGVIDTALSQAGNYRLTMQGLTGGVADIEFAVSEVMPTADLGFVSLSHSTSLSLDEITVTAQRPLVVKEIDRIGYDVKADPESTTAPLIDILRKVPMVTVDGEGNISVNGSSSFKIYKNGRSNNSFTKNAKDLFKAIPASSIRKIEVITDPGAREDAEGVGAILNIVTDSDTAIEGITGTVNLYADTNNGVPNPRLWLSSQIGKVTFSVYGNYYNINRRESENSGLNTGKYLDSGETLTFADKNSSRSNTCSGGFELSYEPDTLNLFTASMDLYQNYSKSDSRRDYMRTSADGSLLQSYTQTSFYPRSRYLDIDANVNYQRSTRLKGENITLSYQISTTGQKQKQQTDYTDAFNLNVPYSGILSDFDLRFFEHTFQFDWTRPVSSRHTLDIGAKYIARRNHSKNFRDYTDYRQTYDDFFHNTDIAAAYADFRAKFGKFGLRGGFRYEYSRLAAKFREGDGTDFHSSINDYVPNATVSYSPDDANTFKLTFNRRISRPGISYLDPTVSTTPQSTSSGNPNLRSAEYNTIYFNYSLIKNKFNCDFSVNYRFSDNTIESTMEVVGDHIYYSYGNVGRFRQLSGSLYVRWSPGDKTSFHSNLYYALARYSMPDGTSLTRPVYNPTFTWQQTLPFRMKFTANIGWWSGSVSGAYSYMKPSMAYFWNNFRLQRFFLSEDRLSIGLGLNNPFGPYKRKSTTVTASPGYYSEHKSCSPHNFSICLTASYRFGSLNASVKKTATSISNDDLQGRKN